MALRHRRKLPEASRQKQCSFARPLTKRSNAVSNYFLLGYIARLAVTHSSSVKSRVSDLGTPTINTDQLRNIATKYRNDIKKWQWGPEAEI
jgi:hypothetical protein